MTFIKIPPSNYIIGRTGLHPGSVMYRPEIVVIHLADGTYNGTISWFQNPQSKVSSHYLVSRTGATVQFVDEADTAYHAGVVYMPTWDGLKRHPGINCNLYSIGIEHEGHPADEWTMEMYTASIGLVAATCARWGIVPSPDTIIRHSTINARHGQCPGPHCDLNRIIQGAAAIISH